MTVRPDMAYERAAEPVFEAANNAKHPTHVMPVLTRKYLRGPTPSKSYLTYNRHPPVWR